MGKKKILLSPIPSPFSVLSPSPSDVGIRSSRHDVFERRTSTGSGFFLKLFVRDFEQILGQIDSIRVKTLSNTNLVALRHIKKEKCSLPVVRSSKTP